MWKERSNLLRLMQATGSLSDAGDYALFIRAAAEQNNFNEASTPDLNSGIAAKSIDPTKASFADIVTGLKSKPIATEADLATASKTAQTGIALVHIGDRYAATGNYAKAIEAYRLQGWPSPAPIPRSPIFIWALRSRGAGDRPGRLRPSMQLPDRVRKSPKYWLIYVNQKA